MTYQKVRLHTPLARLSYPAIFKQAKPMKETDTPKYQAELIFSKDADISALEDAIEEVLNQQFPDKSKRPKKMTLPIRDGDIDREGKDGYDHSVFICPRSKDKPGVLIGRNKEVVTDETEVVGGDYVIASLTAFWYDEQVNKGVSFALNNIWKIRDGEPFASRVSADDDFEDADVDDSMFDADSYESRGGGADVEDDDLL